jgi:PPM family protein phosphatase
VDTFTVEAKANDVFVLCSDGLTTMVDDEKIAQTVANADSLEHATKALVKAANRAGGEDNVTVVLFQLEAEPASIEDTAVAPPNGRGETDLEDTLSGLEVPAALAASSTAVLEREKGEETQAAWGRPLDEEESQRKPAKPPKRRRWGRRIFWSALGLAFVLAVIAAAFWALSRANFIGADEDGNVVVYQGVPWELGGGIDLFRARYVSRLQAVQLAEPERKMLFDHDLISYDEARDRLAPYEAEGVP